MLPGDILTRQPADHEDRQKASGCSHSRENSYQFRHVCPSVSSHVSARLLMDGFVLNLVLETFIKICMENIIFLHSDKIV
jgi:hypothetical protein